MKSDCVLDTNILIYAAAGRADEPHKFQIAQRLVAEQNFGLSGQILAEFYTVMLRRTLVPPTQGEIDSWIELLCHYPVAAIDESLVRAAIALSQRWRISYWDAAILAAAERLAAPILYTEDLGHGQTYGSVRVVNPFRSN
ncbi:PIN domain-containing protein [Enterovirga rhinocerotis]|uniref:Ribonuclease VapC n=1 Tax=Enterovirga rhinocerotis TaxID=1339210 RepID=A0A4R7BJS3_9HYPH|nr:PIN domain-containing protein [Enterovirga rhinocerotis]TDR85451.1 putative nucleic acid-binding protein [Enterovirga rhinocerotis]